LLEGCNKNLRRDDLLAHLAHHEEVRRLRKEAGVYTLRFVITRFSRDTFVLLGEDHCVRIKVGGDVYRNVSQTSPSLVKVSLSCLFKSQVSKEISALVRQYSHSGYEGGFKDESEVSHIPSIGKYSHSPCFSPRSYVREDTERNNLSLGPWFLTQKEELLRFRVREVDYSPTEGDAGIEAVVCEVVFRLH
jgi:hypothetical protein